MQRIQSDVLVVGGGGAGLTAAVYAARSGARVAVVNKGIQKHSGATIMAPGAIACVDDRWKTAGDSKEQHYSDTFDGGAYINDPRLVKRVVFESAQVCEDLERMGAFFERREDGAGYLLRTDGGHCYPRSLHNEDKIGREMVTTLTGELEKHRIPVYEQTMITRLITRDSGLTGAVGIRTDTLESILFECSALVLATGGMGYVYENTDNPIDLTGDGIALALDNGLPLLDMEFIQFYPLGYLFPPSLKGLFGAYINHVRLYNNQGERFMAKYNAERMELTTRDILSSAIMKEVLEGRGSPHGGVYADFKHLAPGVMEREMPGFYKTYRKIGFDPQTQSLEIAPTVHFSMGGIMVDPDWRTALPGLYAVGETAGGVHGANRVSQNALTDMLVSGKKAGECAAEYARGRKAAYRTSPRVAEEEESRIRDMMTQEGDIGVREYRDKLRSVMWEKVGVLRDANGLASAVSELRKLLDLRMRIYNHGTFLNGEVLCAMENINMAKAGLATALSAQAREETRGAHIRLDYPETNDAFRKNTVVRKEGSDYTVAWRNVPQEDM